MTAAIAGQIVVWAILYIVLVVILARWLISRWPDDPDEYDDLTSF